MRKELRPSGPILVFKVTGRPQKLMRQPTQIARRSATGPVLHPAGLEPATL